MLTQVQFRSHLFCTWGAEGAAALKIPEMTIFQSQAFLVEGAGGKVIESVKSSNPCTDLGRLLTSIFQSTIGAGDTFIAGILYGLFYNFQNWDLEKALKFANELAGRKVTQEGFSGLIKGLESWL